MPELSTRYLKAWDLQQIDRTLDGYPAEKDAWLKLACNEHLTELRNGVLTTECLGFVCHLYFKLPISNWKLFVHRFKLVHEIRYRERNGY